MLIGGLALCLSASHEANAQSKKTLGKTAVEIEGLKSLIYEHWKMQTAAKPDLYKILLPIDLKSDTDAAEMVIYPVTDKKDDVVANLKKLFEPPSFAKSIDEVTRVEAFKVGKANVTALMTQGTYLKSEGESNAKVTKVANQRMRAYLFEVGDKKYVVRVVGPFKSMGIHLADCDAWAKAFK
jgi:hypothetical protein